MTSRALVVGAGPAGLSAAMQLASWCACVEVVEARPRAQLRHTGEHLPPAGLTSIVTLGFGALLDDPRHQASSGVCSAWGEAGLADKDYFLTPAGSGKNLRRDVFDEALAQAAEQQGARLNFATRLTGLKVFAGRYQATLRGPSHTNTIDCDIVIDASGRNARAARLLGGTIDRNDDMVGIVGQIDGCQVTEDVGRLYIEAVDQGWWYGVQFPDGQLICTYMTDAARLSAYPGGAMGLWQDELPTTQVLAPLAGTGHSAGEVHVFDASTQILKFPECAGFMAVGDAAVAFDPLSSWGITKGLVDGHQAAQALQRDKKKPSDASAKYREERWTQYHNYRRQRTAMYRVERRWPHSEFWQARQRVAVES